MQRDCYNILCCTIFFYFLNYNINHMTLKLPQHILLVSLFLVFGQVLKAQTTASKNNPITTAVPYLRIAADPRAAAMGDMGVATSPDANSLFYNGAKTAFNESKYGISASYTPYLQELDVKNLYLLSLGTYYKLSENEALSLGVRYFSQGDFSFTDNIGQEIKTYKPNDFSLEAGYSRKLSKTFGVGLNMRYIQSKLADNSTYADVKTGKSVAADISAFYQGIKGLNLGLAFTNLGSKISYTGDNNKNYIPANIALGASYSISVDADNKISFGAEVNKLLVPTPPDPADADAVAKYNNKSVVSSWFSSYGDAPGGFKEELKEIQLGGGAEYSYQDKFMLRAGYFSENKLKGYRNYATAGVGVKYKVAGLNFSYLIPTGPNAKFSGLENTFRLGLTFGCTK